MGICLEFDTGLEKLLDSYRSRNTAPWSAGVFQSLLSVSRTVCSVLKLAFLFVVLINKPAASDSRCAVFDDLAALIHLSDLFLENVETGANPKAPGQLTKFLNDTPVVELRVRLTNYGFVTISSPTAKFIALQKTLLRLRSLSGPDKAAETARKMQMRQRLKIYRRQLVAMPCFEGRGRSVTGAFSESDTLVSSKVASFGAIFLLIAGVVAFLIFDRINKSNARKKKRFLCNTECMVAQAGESALIEAQIVDVSRLGAKVKSEVTCPVGAEVEISLPERTLVFPKHRITFSAWSIAARVLWRNGNYFGLEFNSIMGEDHLDQLVATG